jgi:hypothetical protein
MSLFTLSPRWGKAFYAAAQAGLSVATHALRDRSWPARWLLERGGSPRFAAVAGNGMNGMYLADLLCTTGRLA